MDQAFIRIYHLFQIRVLISDKREAVIIIVFLINTSDLHQVDLAIDVCRGEYTTGEITAYGDEVDPA